MTDLIALGGTTDAPELSADEGVQSPPGDRLDAGRNSACTPNSPSVDTGAGVPLPEAPAPDPLTQDEYDAIVHAIFDGLDADPWRVGDLLADALGFIGRLAIDGADGFEEGRAAGLLRRMEQRALWGPTEPRPEVRP